MEKLKRGYVKLNFDGSSKTTSASIGGVFIDHDGAFLLGYSERIGKGDAQFVVDILVKTNRVKSKDHVKHANEIRKLASLLHHFHASHIYRKGNKVADKLAKLGHDMKKIKIWRDVPPAEINSIGHVVLLLCITLYAVAQVYFPSFVHLHLSPFDGSGLVDT
ncbi:uncharacterized protein LOC144561926 [Carex rostrata]